MDTTLYGNIEQWQAGMLLGWVASKQHCNPIAIKVLANGKLVGRGIADIFREDLKAAGINNGSHAFRIPLEELRTYGRNVSLSIVEDQSSTKVSHPDFDLEFDSVLYRGSIDGIESNVATISLNSQNALAGTNVILYVDGYPISSRVIEQSVGIQCCFDMEIPAEYLDGTPHTITLGVDGYSDCLASRIEVLRPIAVPWYATRGEVYSSPLASEARYNNLKSHISKAHNGETAVSISDICIAHQLLETASGTPDLSFMQSRFDLKSSAAVIVPFNEDLKSLYFTLASLVVAHTRTQYQLIIAVAPSHEASIQKITQFNGISIVYAESASDLDLRAVAESIDAEYIAYIQAGLEVGEGWLDDLLEPFNSRNDESGVSVTFGKVINSSGQLKYKVNTNIEAFQHNPFAPEANVYQFCAPTPEAFALKRATLMSNVPVKSPALLVSGVTFFFGAENLDESVVNQLNQLYTQPPKKKRILFIDSQVPSLGRDAGSYAAIQEMKLVQGLGFDVTFCPENLKNIDGNTEFLQSQGIEVLYAPYYQSVYDVVTKRGHEFSAVYITRYGVAEKWIELIRSFMPHAKILFNNADLHFLRELRQALALSDPKAIEASLDTRERELEVCKKVDAILCYNTTEQAVITSHMLETGKLYTTPWVLESQGLGFPLERRQGLVFLGSAAHAPNIDALNFLHDKVMPLLRAERPDIRLYVYGSGMEGLSSTYNSENIVIKGFVPSLDDVFHQHRVFVCPLSFGAGIKGKVLDAMTYGVPCVLSDIAAEGTGLEQGVNTLIAHSEKEWAEAIIKLYEDEELWNSLSNNSKKLAASKYSFEHGLSAFKQIFQSLNIKSTD